MSEDIIMHLQYIKEWKYITQIMNLNSTVDIFDYCLGSYSPRGDGMKTIYWTMAEAFLKSLE